MFKLDVFVHVSVSPGMFKSVSIHNNDLKDVLDVPSLQYLKFEKPQSRIDILVAIKAQSLRHLVSMDVQKFHECKECFQLQGIL
jgi:hypothetical protein